MSIIGERRKVNVLHFVRAFYTSVCISCGTQQQHKLKKNLCKIEVFDSSDKAKTIVSKAVVCQGCIVQRNADMCSKSIHSVVFGELSIQIADRDHPTAAADTSTLTRLFCSTGCVGGPGSFHHKKISIIYLFICECKSLVASSFAMQQALSIS